MARASDQILHDDLLACGHYELATRALKGEWNDYFGDHDMPQHALLAELRGLRARNGKTRRVEQNVIDGKYDATKAESDEWAASPEGQDTMREFGL